MLVSFFIKEWRTSISITYLGIIIIKDGGWSKDVKNRIAKTQGVYSQLKSF